MTDDFTDIKIKELDDAASMTAEGALFNIVFRLSQKAPRVWANHFNKTWNAHIYMMKRTASVMDDRLEIVCAPDELEPHHLPELHKIISQTNEDYRDYRAVQLAASTAQDEGTRQERATLANLKSRLKF